MEQQQKQGEKNVSPLKQAILATGQSLEGRFEAVGNRAHSLTGNIPQTQEHHQAQLHDLKYKWVETTNSIESFQGMVQEAKLGVEEKRSAITAITQVWGPQPCDAKTNSDWECGEHELLQEKVALLETNTQQT